MRKTSNKIYVQLPAYRDTELQYTLDELLAKASRPDDLRISVLWQHEDNEKLPARFKRKNIEVRMVPYQKSKGCNWARNILQKGWKGEKYTLIIDSHHRFIDHWDQESIAMVESLRSDGILKPLLTAYLPAYNPKDDPGDRRMSPLKIYFLERSMGLLTRVTSREVVGWQLLKKPIPAHYVSLHFLFTDGVFNEEVQFDPNIYFFGDEVSIGLRAFTLGYSLFHPHKILGWHEYKRSTRIPHWEDHAEWWQQDAESHLKLKAIFTGQYKGKFGTGRLRTISDYEKLIGRQLFSLDDMNYGDDSLQY